MSDIVQRPSDGRRSISSASISSALVLLTAYGFDVLAGETRDHVLGVVLSAAAVWLMRLVLRRRLHGLFALINLAVLVQPAAHALTKLTDSVATHLPHDHLLPESVPALLLQVATTLLVVLVAGSEPLLEFVGARRLRVLATLLGVLVPADPRPSSSFVVDAAPEARPRALLLARSLPRRGPPVAAGMETWPIPPL